MSNSTQPNQATALAQLQALVAGTQKHFPSGTLTLGNTAYAPADLVQAFQSLITAMNATNAAHVQTRDAVSAQRGIEAKVVPLKQLYRRFLLATFNNAPQQLADFGMQPAKARTPLSGEQRAAANAKSRATRAARGTTSKKQKLAVKGDVSNVSITPVKVAPVDAQPAVPAVPPASTGSAPGAATK